MNTKTFIIFFLFLINSLSIKVTQDICKLPSAMGDCKGLFTKYFYDSSTGLCTQFTYSGCGGNANRFETLNECESACKN